MEIRKGQVWRIEAPWTAIGDEVQMDRPVIVVSSDDFNEKFKTVMVVPLTSAVQYHDLNTNIMVRSAVRRPSTALCHMVQTVSVKRFEEYWGTVTDAELTQIEIALAIGLGLSGKQAPAKPELLETDPAPVVRQAEAERMVRLATERNVFKKLYEDLLAKMLGEEVDEE